VRAFHDCWTLFLSLCFGFRILLTKLPHLIAITRVGAIGHAYEGEISSDDMEGASRVLASAGAGWLSPAAGGRMLFESPAEVLGSASRLCENLAAGVGSLRPAGILGV